MTPKKFFSHNNEEVCARVARIAGTTLANFRHIALYKGACSKALAKRLAEASEGSMTRDEILFPEDYEDSAA